MNYLKGHYATIPINKTEIPQSILNIDNKTRSNPLTWKAQFSPQFIEALLEKYSKPGDVVFDPFLGSGTVLFECGVLGHSALGTEVNPAAVILSRLYTLINVKREDREILVNFIEKNSDYSLLNDESKHIDFFNKLLKKSKNDENLTKLIEANLVLSDFLNSKDPSGKILKTWRNIKNLVRILPYSKSKIDVFVSDARKTPLKTNSVDLVITSPPYINVYNYHQQYRRSIELLDWEILQIAKSEIGSNRKHRSNRFLTVIQYCLDLEEVFSELLRVCKSGSRIIFVVGRESNVKGTPFNNGELVSEIAYEKFGMQLVLKQERFFTNRYGEKIYEDILHFVKKGHEKNGIGDARSIAKRALNEALKRADNKNTVDIMDALSKIDHVQQSPLLAS